MPKSKDPSLDADALIDAVIDREGRYVNHPADRGGPTCWGITEAVARAGVLRRDARPAAHRRRRHLPPPLLAASRL